MRGQVFLMPQPAHLNQNGALARNMAKDKEIVLDVDFPGANFLLLTFAQHAPTQIFLDDMSWL
jgi:hypothetical protein